MRKERVMLSYTRKTQVLCLTEVRGSTKHLKMAGLPAENLKTPYCETDKGLLLL